ncbi:MAG TPA: corrinoid protein [Candidatus Anoxymicrobiaceae bacterium]|jgi:5-methyltetrahydrofolate--homocysteine methyltransferase
MDWEEDLPAAVTEGDEIRAEELAGAALGSGAPPREVLEKGAVAGIYETGRLWQEGDYFLPDVILSIEAFNKVMEMVEPLLAGEVASTKGKVVLGSVEGDAHDLGKNIVAAMLRSSLYEVIDLGIDVSAERFVEAARDMHPDVIGLGAYMTTTMRNMEGVITALREAGLRDSVKLIIGGAPVTAEYAERIGADGFGADAVGAVALVDRLLGVS